MHLMKNKYIEHKIRKAKHYAKKWGSTRKLNEHGNYIIHKYDESKTISWWDDVFFKFGSQIIAVWWVHPRQYYHDLCTEKINEQRPYPNLNFDEIFTASTPNYKSVGKTGKRKKISSYTSAECSAEITHHFTTRQHALNQLLTNGDIIAQPFIKITQYDWCRGVELCLPIEILNEHDVNTLVDITKQLLMRTTTIDKLFPNYQYDKNDWVKEQLITKGE